MLITFMDEDTQEGNIEKIDYIELSDELLSDRKIFDDIDPGEIDADVDYTDPAVDTSSG